MADLTFKQLKQQVAALTKEVTRGSDAIRSQAHAIDEEARDTSNVAEMIAGMGVDTATVGETRDLSRLAQGVSEAALAYAAAGDNTAKSATAAHDQTQASHGGIAEAATRSPVDLRNVDRRWFTQE